MISPANNAGSPNGTPAPAPRKRISPLLIGILIIASILVPLVFWQGTWFGSQLSDDQLAKYLADRDNPRHVQHALVQLTERIDKHDPNVTRFYPALLALVDHPRAEVRSTLAWTMGWSPEADGFHDALRTLLTDYAPLVRRNAALSLSKVPDPACRPVLHAMLEPYAVTATVAGELTDLPPKDRPVKAHSHLATITPPDAASVKVYAPLDGRILKVEAANGSPVAIGDVLCTLAPGEKDLREALRAFALVGTAEDLDAIRAALNRTYATKGAAEQGEITIKLIEKRSADASTNGL